MTITKTWEPARTDTGLSIGKFLRLAEKTHYKNDGEEFTVLNAYFLVQGKDGREREIPYRLSDSYHPHNRYGLFGKALGFTYKEVIQERKDGLRIVAQDNLNELEEIIESTTGKEFEMIIDRNEQTNLYDIQIESLSGLSESSKMPAKSL